MEKLLENYRRTYEALSSEIENNIPKYRKGDFEIRVQTKDGTPVRATVTPEQKSHAFDFGTNVVMLGSLGEREQAYRDAVTNLFNLVTTTFCWSITEIEEGVFRFDERIRDIYRRPPAERVWKFAQENGLRAKGQPLLADSWYPDWASREPDTLKKQYIRYFEEVARRYDGKYYLFDVVNESYYANNRTPHFPLLQEGAFAYVKWALKTAGEIFSKNCILERNEGTEVNAGEWAQRYYQENKEILETGIRLDSIGHQFHFFDGASCLKNHVDGWMGLEQIYAAYHKMSTLGVPLYISEITIPTVYEGVSPEQGEAIQAELLDKLYHLWFSIPQMQGIIYWNLKDGDAWKNEGDCKGCLTDGFMRKKPSYYTVEHLLKREWNTSFQAQTDEGGVLAFSGFYGDYTVTVETDGHPVQRVSAAFDKEHTMLTVIAEES